MEQILVEGAKGIRFRINNLWVEEGKQTPVPDNPMVRKLIKSKSIVKVDKKKKKAGK